MEAIIEQQNQQSTLADRDGLIEALAQLFQKEDTEIEAIIGQLAQALNLTEIEAARFLRDYGKPAWYILYRLETGQPLDLPFPETER